MKLIMDLDTGVDDALAISYALGSPEVDLIGITGTYGNVLVETGVRNSLAVLNLFGRTDVPVYAGLSHSSTTKAYDLPDWAPEVHGANGIGNIAIPDSPRAPEEGSAIDFIIDAADKYGKDLIYLPTGSPTNLAAVLQKDPSFKDKVGKVVMMGGTLTTDGNVSPCTEANISDDPESADLVFKSGLNLTMVGLDVTLQTLLTKRETAVWRDLGTKAGIFLADMTDYYIDFEQKTSGLEGCGLHDPLAVAVACDPTLVKTFGVNLHVNLEGELRGRVIGDHLRLKDSEKSVQACLEVDVDRFLHMFMDRLTKLAAQH